LDSFIEEANTFSSVIAIFAYVGMVNVKVEPLPLP